MKKLLLRDQQFSFNEKSDDNLGFIGYSFFVITTQQNAEAAINNTEMSGCNYIKSIYQNRQ